MFIFNYIILSVLGLYIMWIFYLALMSLDRARRAGMLSRTTTLLAYPILGIGLVLDALLNWFVFTILFLDVPHEWLITPRLRRIEASNPAKWQLRLIQWLRKRLDPFDPTGAHI